MSSKGQNRSDSGSSYAFFPVAPDDNNDIAVDTRGLCIATAGNLVVTRLDGVTVTIAVPVGIIPIQVQRVLATGTTAAGITALV